MLSEAEIRRYNRQIGIPEIGEKGQEKLKKAKVLVIGAGGLGSPVLQYLTMAGIGQIAIVDDAVVNEDNLHQQSLYGGHDLGKLKTIISRQRLKSLNPLVNHDIFNIRIYPGNALDFVSRYDIIVDATNTYSSHYLINDACIIAKKPWVFASTSRFEGRVSTFNFSGGPSLRCAFPDEVLEKIDEPFDNTSFGLLSGIIGSFQSVEVIKLITGIGKPLTGTLLIYNMLEQGINTLGFEKNLHNFELKELKKTY